MKYRNTGGISPSVMMLDRRFPRTASLLLIGSKLSPPVRATTTLEMEGQGIQLTGEGLKIGNVETNLLRGDKELEGAIRKQGDMKMESRATNGGMNDGAHRWEIKAKPASPKGNNERKGVRIKSRRRNRETKVAADISLNLKPRAKERP